MKRIFLIPILFALPVTAEARERHEFYNGIRCQSMGGACVAVVNDETSLLVNPAALGKLRDMYGTILDPELEVNSLAQESFLKSPSLDIFQMEKVKSTLESNLGSYYHARSQLFPSFVARNFGIGLFSKSSLDARASEDGTTFDTFYRSDLAFVLGYNLRLLDGRLKIGFNAKLVNRIEVDDPALSATGPMEYSSIAKEGVGLSTDVGLMLAAPWTFLPTITAVVRDVGGTTFDKAKNIRMTTTERPQAVKQDMDVGVAFFPIHSRYVRSSWTLQYNGILTLDQEEDKAKRMHAGIEFNFGDVFFVRGGYNQRYWTGGLELASEFFQVQLGSYGEEIGTQANPEEDRRYSLKLAWRF